MRLCSFDVFDTLLTRTFAVPKDLFLEVGARAFERGVIEVPHRHFALERVQAEARARRQVPEIILDEIYAALGEATGWSVEMRDQLKALELELEEESLQAVEAMRSEVAAARAAGARVIFLSDMYLPSSFVQRLLAQAGFFEEGDRLWISGEHRVSKARGELFALVREAFPGLKTWEHWGDHPHADRAVPRELGIGTHWVRAARLNRYERMARGEEEQPPLWRSWLAGAMRLSRLEAPRDHAQGRVIWELGCGVVGPLLVGYVHWCLEQAAARGLKRLYFVARDGQILWRLAECRRKSWSYDIEGRYLYGSRRAWRTAAMEAITDQDLDWVMPPDAGLTLRQVFGRLGLDPAALGAELSARGFGEEGWDLALDGAGAGALLDLLRSEPFSAQVAAAAAAQRAAAMGYLTQEGLLEGVPFALVDIGWRGNLQKSVSRMMRLSGHEGNLIGFYLGLYEGCGEGPGQLFLDYWHQSGAGGQPLARQNVTLFEIFTAADHGSVLGYERRGERWEPVLESVQHERALRWGLRTLQAAVLSFARHWTGVCRPEDCSWTDYLSLSKALYETFYFHPTRQEASVIGQFDLGGQQIESIHDSMVPDWSSGRIVEALLDYRKRPTSWWMEGTLAVRKNLWLRWFLFLRRCKWWWEDLERREG